MLALEPHNSWFSAFIQAKNYTSLFRMLLCRLAFWIERENSGTMERKFAYQRPNFPIVGIQHDTAPRRVDNLSLDSYHLFKGVDSVNADLFPSNVQKGGDIAATAGKPMA
jgi:hypothetical protein